MKIFALIPRNFNLSKKLTTLMLTILLGGIIVSSAVYYPILLGTTKNELKMQADVLISTMDSVRRYNQLQVNGLLEKQSEQNLLLPSIPDYAVRTVFETLIANYKDKYGKYSYKDAMMNPTNPKDQATEDEMSIIKELSLAAQNSEKQDFLMINGEKKFYIARPIKVTDKNCLICHTSLEKSPASLQRFYKQNRYGANQGFGWKFNEIIGTKIIYVPASQVYKTTQEHFLIILGIFTAIFAAAIFLANLWLKQYVVRPLHRITQVAEAVSLGDMDANFEKHSNDEVGRLADAFALMKTSVEIALKRLASQNRGMN